MTNTISRDTVLTLINDVKNAGGFNEYSYYEYLFDQVDKMPVTTPSRKEGKWIKEYDNSSLDGLYHCSVCGRKLWIHNEESVLDYPYCHCGSKMESE